MMIIHHKNGINVINANNFDVTSAESTRESCVRGKRRGIVDQHFRCRRMPRLSNDNKFLVRCVLDLFCIAVIGVPIIIFFAIGKPFQRGFYCDDESLRYPYKESTINNKVLYCVGTLFPAAVIIIIETLRFYTNKTSVETPTVNGIKLHPIFWEVYQLIWVFAFGACISQLITDIAKYSIGRLRPHFIDVCQPSIDVNKCNDSHRYILPSDFSCLNSDTFRVRESRLSFMSGHASFSAYCMVFVAMYLQARFVWKCNKLLRPFLQAVVLFSAYYTALSRVSDYKHHWSDVLTGSIQGIIVAIIVVLFVSDLFPNYKNNYYISDASSDSSNLNKSNKKNTEFIENERSSV
ncbi:phospholipid phosphatase 1-like isoform X2 [Centruroides vittatus]|uniref:phospholipid phosphatase 1-like isoform X2 n=1 Tax=Centruroides vittatus TaxID=120091 RepID=UPI00350F5A9C